MISHRTGHHWISKRICAGTHTTEYIPNDLEKGLHSETTKSVDDGKLFKAHCKEQQKVLMRLGEWILKWAMVFNIDAGKVMHV